MSAVTILPLRVAVRVTAGRKVCAWCRADLGEVEGLAPGQISHGICPACRARHFPEAR